MKKTAYMGLFAAVAIIFGYVESLFPVFAGIPGIKLGLANLVTVFILYTYSYKEAAMISFIRILVIGFLFGNLFSILFSLAGAALSLACMILAKRYLGLSITGVSIVGGVTHNLGQIVVAALVVENVNLFYYFPALLIAGLITGFLIGVLSGEILKRTSGRKLV
ncbi:MAG TPA: Gx transporter family protein [Candidatus Blautia stercoripullorum]|uniref:Gx transporter family protein n=1 Tax=Candidatus Blautia stercoripullorum TaxID=2838502 RepID=A0A9D2RBP2_9FIRM|nr:Gx transporter family protein [Candidatus Blautia stercoripullorum]